jgi:uncharacterized protein
VSGIPVQVCDACGHAVFPRRVLCPRCGSREWHLERAASGVVEELTTHRRGGLIASVRTVLGPVVIARAPDGAPPGAPVSLSLERGAPVARLEVPLSA